MNPVTPDGKDAICAKCGTPGCSEDRPHPIVFVEVEATATVQARVRVVLPPSPYGGDKDEAERIAVQRAMNDPESVRWSGAANVDPDTLKVVGRYGGDVEGE